MLMLAWDCAGAGVPPVFPLLPFATGMVTPHPAQNAKAHPLKRTTRGPVQRLNGRIDNSKELSCQGSAFGPDAHWMRQPLILTHAAAEQTSPAAIQVLLISNLLHERRQLITWSRSLFDKSNQLTQPGVRRASMFATWACASRYSVRPPHHPRGRPVSRQRRCGIPLSVSSSAFSRWITSPSASACCSACCRCLGILFCGTPKFAC